MDETEIKCACKGSFLDKFLQPALLAVLQEGSSHGFQMISSLERSGMVSGDSLDPAGMYRALKRMESGGLTESYWDTETTAKPRRIYSITDKGRACLRTWEKTLLDYRDNIDAILSAIRGESGPAAPGDGT